jgi:hypothetical protein
MQVSVLNGPSITCYWNITFGEYMRPAVVWSNIFNRVFLSCTCKEMPFEERTLRLKVHV